MASPAAGIALLLATLVLTVQQIPLGSCSNSDTKDGPEASNSGHAQGSQQHQQCLSRCAACQSLRPARIGLICAHGPLSGCGCPEFALNLTAATGATSSPGPAAAASDSDGKNCPSSSAASRIGYCPYGQETDATTGCPLPVCRPAPGCQRQPVPADDCRAHCLAGFQIDANGCPVCRCLGAPSSSSTPQPPPPQQQQPQSCLLRCPNSCGPYGYADGESRDERGCVRDCACRCPAVRQGCPNNDGRCLRWEVDRFGCQVCSACSGTSTSLETSSASSSSSSSSACITKAMLQADGSGSIQTIGRLCPAKCSADYLLAEDTNSGCLTCTCHQQPVATASSSSSSSNSNKNSNHGCPPEPRCAGSCGPHGRLRDARGCVASATGPTACACDCPGVDLEACLAGCPSGNVTVAKDAYGCHACRCQQNQQQQQQSTCPPSIQQRCSNSCGPHGYEVDPATGCQVSCRCACPNNSGCSRLCFYGSRQDQYGCDTCECISASEYLRFMPF